MFLRLVADSFGRRPRHKLLTGAALALGMGVATAALSVALDVGDRLAKEFRSLGANLVVAPKADSLPLEIGGVDYRPVNAGAYLPEADLPKLKTIFWHNNIVGFAPVLEARAMALPSWHEGHELASWIADVPVVGTWADHAVPLSEGGQFRTGVAQTNPWWHIEGRWFSDDAMECAVGVAFARKHHINIDDSISLVVGPVSEIPVSFKVTAILTSGGPEDAAIVIPLAKAQFLVHEPGQYRKLYVSALTKPEDAFARKDKKAMTPAELDRWYCTPYISSIALQLSEALPGTEVRVIRRVAEGEGQILTHVEMLLWLVTLAAMLAAALAVGASSAASVIERQGEIGLMKALGAGSGTVGFLLAAEQLLLAVVGGGVGYALGIVLARLLGEKIFGQAPEPTLLVFFVVIGLAAVVTLLGSAIPLRRASRIEPAPILRGE